MLPKEYKGCLACGFEQQAALIEKQAEVVDAARYVLENHLNLIPAGSITDGQLTGPASASARWLWDAVKVHDKGQGDGQ